MSLVIKPQTTVALVGITGSGKTTLIDIILGLLSPNSGNISVGDTKITEENIRKWQANLSYVPQSIYLLDGTIEQNIAFTINDHEIDTEKILLACVAAELQEFVDSLPEKLHTQVGERGVRLSGGQRQRIGIARAIYNQSKLIILDEATSALDGITEKKIIDSMHRLSKNLTVIMIAHRITTIQSCDSIHMLEHGSIIASGTYDELMKNEKKFRMMASVTEE
jgi:HlyD family secretion protein